MRFMMLVKADRNSEAGVLPSKELVAAMGQFNEEMVQAGVLLAAEGLQGLDGATIWSEDVNNPPPFFGFKSRAGQRQGHEGPTPGQHGSEVDAVRKTQLLDVDHLPLHGDRHGEASRHKRDESRSDPDQAGNDPATGPSSGAGEVVSANGRPSSTTAGSPQRRSRDRTKAWTFQISSVERTPPHAGMPFLRPLTTASRNSASVSAVWKMFGPRPPPRK